MTDSATRPATEAEVEMRLLREELEELRAKARMFDTFMESIIAMGPHLHTPEPHVEALLDKVKQVKAMGDRLDAAEAVVRAAVELRNDTSGPWARYGSASRRAFDDALAAWKRLEVAK